MRKVQRVAILGSGIMGSGIAAHLANCGIPSLMLDIVPPEAIGSGRKEERNKISETSKRNLLKVKPPALFCKDYLDRIDVGNFEDDFYRISDCDWIIEAVKEDLTIKREILKKIAKYKSPEAIVSTNTSGLPIWQICQEMDEIFQKRFLGIHFFNPPRYMKLVEVIPSPLTEPVLLKEVGAFLEERLGKGVVYAKDTPNFIANRIIAFYCQYILKTFMDYGLRIEDVDLLTGPVIGHPSSATFRTLDIVGLDTFLSVVRNVYENCHDDAWRDYFVPTVLVQTMICNNWLGEKTGVGFYKKTGQRDSVTGRSIVHVLNPHTMAHEPQQKRSFCCIEEARKKEDAREKIRIMYLSDDPGSKFLYDVFIHTAAYAGWRIPEICEDIVSLDNAVKWGFGWSHGIFETWDILGVREVCSAMEKAGIEIPPIAQILLDRGYDSFYQFKENRTLFFDYQLNKFQVLPENPKILRLERLKQANRELKKNASCSLIDLGDGILCAEFHTKMNTIDQDVLDMLWCGVNWVNEEKYQGLVIANQGEHFTAGANLKWILSHILEGKWKELEKAVINFQSLNMAIRFCRGPVVAAPHHYTFGGGIEISQHCAAVVLGAETYGGLVEVGVGLIPGAGGTKEMLRRSLAYLPSSVVDADPFPFVRRAFETIAMAKVSTSGPELIELGYFPENTRICINMDYLVNKAKNMCLGLVHSEYEPPKPAKLLALGDDAAAVFRSAVYQYRMGGFATDHDVVIAEQLSRVLTGGDRIAGTIMTEQDVLELEREAFLFLCGTEKTQARIKHMLETGKPLRN